MLIYFLFFIGFILLIKGADILVEGSSSIAKKFNISDLVVGLTIVSFGTSMPELTVNLIASVQGSSGIAIGNIFGSNIANILLIIGVAASIRALPIQRNTALSEIPFSLAATMLVGFLANAALLGDPTDQALLSRYDGILLLFFFALFMLYVFRISRESNLEDNLTSGNSMPTNKAILLIVLGAIGLFLGGKWVVDGATHIAALMGLSESLIALTIVAIGTSLPELVTSAIAAYRKNTDIAIGNAVGSNIFNLLWVLGISAVIKPLPFGTDSNTDLLVIIGSSSLLLLVLGIGRKNMVGKRSGILFLLLYATYIIYLVMRG